MSNNHLSEVWSPQDFADTLAAAQRVNRQAQLIAEMRAVALMLEKFNEAYEYDTGTGSWSPTELRYEADYLEKNP